MAVTRRLTCALVGVLVLAMSAGAAERASAGAHHHHHHAKHHVTKAKHVKAAQKRAKTTAPLSRHLAYGAFAAGFPGGGLQITQLEHELGAHVAVASSYQGFGDVFPDQNELAEANAGHALLISWDMGSTAATRFTTFTAGSHDSYLAKVASAVAEFGQPIYLRPWPEMNGDWTAFQPTVTGSKPAGGTPAQFIAAWRYVVNFFRSHGATNARWVFNPTSDTYAGTTDVRGIFPGSRYVDVLGLDGFNWGTGGAFQWTSFQQIFKTQYSRLVDLDPGAPVWICEFGSKEPAENDGAPIDPTASKANWYSAMLSSTAFPAVQVAVFFDIDKERDWRVASDSQALQVVSTAVRNASVQSVPS